MQRAVQILKWHSMLHFAEDRDNRPPSILVTTPAAKAYRGETDLFTATRNVLASMNRHIENRRGVDWVASPAHEGENFVDKWKEYPERRKAYYAWHRDLSETLDEALSLRGKGLHSVASRLAASFGAEPIPTINAQVRRADARTHCKWFTPPESERSTLPQCHRHRRPTPQFLWPASLFERLTWRGTSSRYSRPSPRPTAKLNAA